jgi:hypothetical protein
VLVDLDPAVGEVGLAVAQRLDLGAAQDEAGLERVGDRVLVEGFAVGGDELDGEPSSRSLRS